jgi:hypothetical protein
MMARPQDALVSLTVTEAGYFFWQVNGFRGPHVAREHYLLRGVVAMNVVPTRRVAAIRHSEVLVKWPACHGALGEKVTDMFLEHGIVLLKMFRILKTTSRPILRE